MKVFLEVCKMTCLGGSERGACACRCPADCEQQEHPRFQHFRNEAIARMGRRLRSAVIEGSDGLLTKLRGRERADG